MKIEKFKVLLYLKKSGTDKSGKAPIMGRITVNRTMAQFGCKLSCRPELWNARESRLDGKSREAVETNAKLDKLLLAVNAAFDTLVERGQDFDATAVKDLFQGSMETQMTLLRMTDRICEDFEKIRDVEIPAWRTTHILARDLFLFACYTGTAYADAVSVTRENLYTDDEGSLWLKYRRKKNELRASVKLLPEALALIEKYHDDTRPTLFPMIHHPNLQRHMKSLAVLAGVSGRLCYHQARHSFASLITLEAGVPIETISRMLGHSDITTTQVYARVTPKKLFEDMDKYIEATKDLKLIL